VFDKIAWVVIWPWEPHCVHVLVAGRGFSCHSQAEQPLVLATPTIAPQMCPVAAALAGCTTHVFLPDSNHDRSQFFFVCSTSLRRYLLTDNIEALAWARALSGYLKAAEFCISCLYSVPPDFSHDHLVSHRIHQASALCPAFFILKVGNGTNSKTVLLGTPEIDPNVQIYLFG